MKTCKLPGFGNLGVEVYDVNLQTATEDEIVELGHISLGQLLVVVRAANVGISLDRFHHICTAWAVEIPSGGYEPLTLATKYGPQWWHADAPGMTEGDRAAIQEMHRIRKGVEHLKGMVRVTGKRDVEGNSTGMFADGELEWHSNNQGREKCAPVVALLGWEGAKGSRTEFLNTVDAYASLTPEWRRRCDELIAIHQWTPGVMAPGLNPVQDEVLRLNMCPQDGVEVPLAATSTGGLKGLHFPFTTIQSFKGMSQAESNRVLDYLKSQIIRDEFVYGHDWEDGDLLFFDNTVTLHRRPTKDCSKRLMYRMAYNYDRILGQQPGTVNLQAAG